MKDKRKQWAFIRMCRICKRRLFCNAALQVVKRCFMSWTNGSKRKVGAREREGNEQVESDRRKNRDRETEREEGNEGRKIHKINKMFPTNSNISNLTLILIYFIQTHNP